MVYHLHSPHSWPVYAGQCIRAVVTTLFAQSTIDESEGDRFCFWCRRQFCAIATLFALEQWTYQSRCHMHQLITVHTRVFLRKCVGKHKHGMVFTTTMASRVSFHNHNTFTATTNTYAVFFRMRCQACGKPWHREISLPHTPILL